MRRKIKLTPRTDRMQRTKRFSSRLDKLLDRYVDILVPDAVPARFARLARAYKIMPKDSADRTAATSALATLGHALEHAYDKEISKEELAVEFDNVTATLARALALPPGEKSDPDEQLFFLTVRLAHLTNMFHGAQIGPATLLLEWNAAADDYRKIIDSVRSQRGGPPLSS
jgi:hypothetical protein